MATWPSHAFAIPSRACDRAPPGRRGRGYAVNPITVSLDGVGVGDISAPDQPRQQRVAGGDQLGKRGQRR